MVAVLASSSRYFFPLLKVRDPCCAQDTPQSHSSRSDEGLKRMDERWCCDRHYFCTLLLRRWGSRTSWRRLWRITLMICVVVIRCWWDVSAASKWPQATPLRKGNLQCCPELHMSGRVEERVSAEPQAQKSRPLTRIIIRPVVWVTTLRNQTKK